MSDKWFFPSADNFFSTYQQKLIVGQEDGVKWTVDRDCRGNLLHKTYRNKSALQGTQLEGKWEKWTIFKRMDGLKKVQHPEHSFVPFAFFIIKS